MASKSKVLSKNVVLRLLEKTRESESSDKDKGASRRDPEEVIQSKAKSFRNFLELAHECLTNKDYANAEMIYGSILTDLTKDYVYAAYDMNDLMIFSLHTSYAYCLVAINSKSEQAMILLSSLQKPTKLPLIQYLKAFVHVANNHIPFAQIEIKICERLLEDGYDFTQHDHLNENLIPELNDEFLKLKLDGLKLACDYLLAKENSDEQKENFKERWMKLGVLCESDFCGNRKNGEPKKKVNDAKTEPPEAKPDAKKNQNKKTTAAAAAKKNETAVVKENGTVAPVKKVSIAIQTAACKAVNAEVQTPEEKNASKNLLAAINDMKSKLNNLTTKKDLTEIKQMQKKSNELCEKLMRSSKTEETGGGGSELEFYKNQYLEVSHKADQYQQQIRSLEKVLVEQMNHKYQLQKQHYLWLEDRCNKKLEYLSDIQKLFKPGRNYGSEQVPQEVLLWKNTLEIITGAKRNFDDYFQEIDDMMTESRYGQIKVNNWPDIPTLPIDTSDIVHKYYKDYLRAKDYTFTQPITNRPPFYNNTNGYHVNKVYNGHQNYAPNSYVKFNADGKIVVPQCPPPAITAPSPTNLRTVFSGLAIVNNRPSPSPEPTSTSSSSRSAEETASGGYESEQELLEYLKSNFRDLDDMLLLQSVYKARDRNGGTLAGLNREKILTETKKSLDRLVKGATSPWGTNLQTLWSSEGKLCCICLEDYKQENCHKLKCLHEFHKQCITDWLNRQNACPICRVHTTVEGEFPALIQA